MGATLGGELIVKWLFTVSRGFFRGEPDLAGIDGTDAVAAGGTLLGDP